jgi:hypothetical protein
MASSSPCFR